MITTNLGVFGAEQSVRDIGFLNRYMISDGENNFEITFAANFLVESHVFNADHRTLHFNIETGLEEGNIAEIVIPRTLINDELTILLNDQEIPSKISKSTRSFIISIMFDGEGKHTLDVIPTKYLETVLNKPDGGGCLIATATFDSELSPQVQLLREIRDEKVMTTKYGSAFMTSFNQFYYSFSPAIADYERENIVFKEVVRITINPMLTSLTILNYVDINSEEEMLGYGIGIILLNIGMYFVAPSIIIMKIRKRVNIEKLDEKYA